MKPNKKTTKRIMLIATSSILLCLATGCASSKGEFRGQATSTGIQLTQHRGCTCKCKVEITKGERKGDSQQFEAWNKEDEGFGCTGKWKGFDCKINRKTFEWTMSDEKPEKCAEIAGGKNGEILTVDFKKYPCKIKLTVKKKIWCIDDSSCEDDDEQIFEIEKP